MIDLLGFSQIKEAVVPLVDGSGQVYGRRFHFNLMEDGWYKLALGNEVTIEYKATPLEILKATKDLKKLRVYALGLEGIPTNFDNFKQLGLGESERIYFLNLGIFEVAKVIRWEDKKLYFYEQTIPQSVETIQATKEAFEKESSLAGIKGITPELRYYFVLCSLQRQSYRAVAELDKFVLSGETKRKRLAEFQQSFAGRLEDAIEKAGGKLVRYNKQGNGYLVHWRIGDQLVKSTIRDDMRIISAGFCLEGEDKKHTLGSLINLAKLFQEDQPLYITRE